MNAITAHLEAAFDAYPQTAPVLEVKAELQAMMEDAYESLVATGVAPSDAAGRVIFDFGNLDELAPALGIANGTSTAGNRVQTEDKNSAHPPVTLTEARSFAATARVARFYLGAAVFAFVASPIPVVLLIAGADARIVPTSVEVAIAIGIGLLLLIAAGGALCLVHMFSRLAPFERLRDRRFTPNSSVERWTDALAIAHERRRAISLAIAVVLWVLSPLPLIVAALVEPTPTQGLWIAGGAAFVLLAVAGGLLLQLPATWARYVAEKMTAPKL
jgi:hypothetical protein